MTQPTPPPFLRDRAAAAATGAGANALKALDALVESVGALVDHALDRVLLRGERVTSAVEARRLLAREENAEELTGRIQRVVVLAVPVIRVVSRTARFTRVPWVMIASSAISVGVAVRTGVRELQVVAALVAHRLEQATGAPGDPELVKKLSAELYLDPKGRPDLGDDRLPLLGLTRKWVLTGAIGRTTAKRAAKAFDAAERLDAAAASAEWEAARRPRGGSSPGEG